MAKKSKKKETAVAEVQQQAPATIDPIEAEFDKAQKQLQSERHSRIGRLFDKAADVLEVYLGDPEVGLAEKMFPAKLVADIYVSEEKFKREDARLELESRKVALEEAKLPPGPQIAIQQNTYINESRVNLAELKKKQEALLSGFLPKEPQPISSDEDKAD